MTNLSREICFKLKEARREAGLSQGEIALEIGCKQSAISMFERGEVTKLSEESVIKYAKKFAVDLKAVEAVDDGERQEKKIESLKIPHTGFCPNPACVSHHRYEVEGRIFLRPERAVTDPVGGRYCAVCGEVLERVCPNCGAAVHEGAVCSICGKSYIMV